MKKEVAWHNLAFSKVIKKLNSDAEQGLSEKEVKTRRRRSGKNLLPKEQPISKLRIFFEQFRSPLIYILLIAGVITLLLKEFTDSYVIFGAVFLNTIVGFFQENKATQTLRALKKVVKYQAEVLRDGYSKVIDSENIVPGDIFILNAGDKVPADGRLIKVSNFKTNEMALTGEWLPAQKKTEVLGKNTAMADRDNMVYMGTLVETGRAKAVATATGIKTEIGKVATMVKETKEEKTPYQKKLIQFSKIIGIVIAIICFLIFIEGTLKGVRFVEMFTTVVSVAVAAIPEGLPVAMTVILSLGMQRILKQKGLVRKLVSTETLGSTSIICTDKTATLTEGKMKVGDILTGEELLEKGIGNHFSALKIATLANEGFVENPAEPMEKWLIRGRPTDRELLLSGQEVGLDKKELEKEMNLVGEIPFDPIHKFIAHLYQTPDEKQVLYVSGAPEKLLSLSASLEVGKRQKKLTWQVKEKIREKLEQLTKRGLRAVAVAYRNIKDNPSDIDNLEDYVEDLTFVALFGLKDPIRKEVKQAMKVCKKAGLKPIIVTGDHKLTARAVAKELGFKVKEENIIEGKALDDLSEEQFKKTVNNFQVYARVEPRHKMRIIDAWQQRGEVVAMTGDGINDAPALKKADIGVALGSGTEVAKETSDLILLTDNFSIIVAAIEEGRAILDNIRKVITYLLSDSFSEIILIGVSLLFGWPLPIVAAQILWVNLIEDGPLGICLAFEPKEKDVMEQKPRGHKLPLLTSEMKTLIFIIGIITDFLLLGLLFFLLKFSNYDIVHIRTLIFTGLTIDSLFYIFSCKSLRKNIWQVNLFSNKFLLFAWVFGIIMLISAIYLPPLQTLLKTVPLTPFDWFLVGGLGLLNIFLIEITKYFFIRKKNLKVN